MSHQVTSRCLPQHTLPPIYEIFVGRQPIYTQQLDVFAYELLFRSGELQPGDADAGQLRVPGRRNVLEGNLKLAAVREAV